MTENAEESRVLDPTQIGDWERIGGTDFARYYQADQAGGSDRAERPRLAALVSRNIAGDWSWSAFSPENRLLGSGRTSNDATAKGRASTALNYAGLLKTRSERKARRRAERKREALAKLASRPVSEWF